MSPFQIIFIELYPRLLEPRFKQVEKERKQTSVLQSETLNLLFQNNRVYSLTLLSGQSSSNIVSIRVLIQLCCLIPFLKSQFISCCP